MIPTILELAQVGAHFGHRKSLTFPKAKRFVYSVQQNVSLIDLEKTVEQLRAAKLVWEAFKQSGRPALLVGTKRPLRAIIRSLGEKYGLAYINERWYGGFLTNFDNFSAEIERYRLRSAEIGLLGETKSPPMNKATRQRLINRLAKNDRFLGGVKELRARPELLIVACGSQDNLALKEANRLGIPIIAITDTDINPDLIAHPIPANDDAPKAVEMILEALLAPSKSTEVKKVPTPRAKKPAQSPESKSLKKVKPNKKTVVPAAKNPAKPAIKKAIKATAGKKIAAKKPLIKGAK